ncbi:MAG: hypothetical protein JWM93_1699 [Frankiales bacterium]|nr:hypothetical protein [Frankiales bacterium]MCW3014010.1 hypothetical protein [Solirubrobacterales bacterium]
MPRYLLERIVGDVSRADLDAIAARSTEIRLERFPQITWEHTHVVRAGDGLRAFCLYESPDAESVRAHADAMGLPVERMLEVETDLSPDG